MVEEPVMESQAQASEKGFVLATALVLLSLMTLMAVAMFFTGKSSTQISSSAQSTTEGHYYAETAVNYMIWAMHNDAEFDSYDYGLGFFPDLDAAVGDWSELNANTWNPGPTEISDDSAGPQIAGQVMYFDNSPLAQRYLSWPDAANNVPTLNLIHTQLPRYIRMDIAEDGTISPSIPIMPHGNVVNVDYPQNGAIAWLTTGNSGMDFELESAPGFAACAGDTIAGGEVACDKTSGKWLRTTGTVAAGDLYGVVVYAIGYVGGRPSSIIRAQIK